MFKTLNAVNYKDIYMNKAQQIRKQFNMDKISSMKRNDPLKLYQPHKLGHVPQFYPQKQLHKFADEM